MKTITSIRTLTLILALAALPALAPAQTTIEPIGATRRAGEREFTLGGGGAANKAFDNSWGGVNFSYGYYTGETSEWVIRQSINYTNPDGRGGPDWIGATRIAYDQHFAGRGALRPFVGVNFGGVYGDSVRDTFAAGLEGGLKFYVRPQTFVYAMGEDGWYFRRPRSLDNNFRDGAFNWGVGLGFNF